MGPFTITGDTLDSTGMTQTSTHYKRKSTCYTLKYQSQSWDWQTSVLNPGTGKVFRNWQPKCQIYVFKFKYKF